MNAKRVAGADAVEVRRSGLPSSRRGLLDLMQEVRYGRILGLVILAGDPVVDPPPRHLRHVRLGKKDDAGRLRETGDFALKASVVSLFSEFDRVQNGYVEELKIVDGLPIEMTVADRPPN